MKTRHGSGRRVDDQYDAPASIAAGAGSPHHRWS